MDPVSAVSQALGSISQTVGVVAPLYFDWLDKTFLAPAKQRRDEYWYRLQNAIPTGENQYDTGVYNEQLKAQQTTIYIIFGLIGLVILAAIVKK